MWLAFTISKNLRGKEGEDMRDQLFGELRYEDGLGWWGKQTLEFGGNQCTVDVLIHDDEEKEISQKQKKTYESFLKKWTTLQEELETIVVAWDFMLEDNRCLYLLFSRSWGGEDLDDNGIGICIQNEKIVEIANKDIAF